MPLAITLPSIRNGLTLRAQNGEEKESKPLPVYKQGSIEYAEVVRRGPLPRLWGLENLSAENLAKNEKSSFRQMRRIIFQAEE